MFTYQKEAIVSIFKEPVMKTIIMMFILALSTASSAATYKWEDAEGMHFTENANSIPKKYRSKALAEARGDITTADPEVAQEARRSEMRARTVNQQDAQNAMRESKLKQQADDARKLQKTVCYGDDPEECGPGRSCIYPSFMGKKVGKGKCVSDGEAKRIVAESREIQKENERQLRENMRENNRRLQDSINSGMDDYQQRKIERRLDDIDRKLQPRVFR
jgi:aconitase B